MTPRCVHVLFNRVDHLPALTYELDALRDAGMELHLICPAYGVDEPAVRERLPHVHLHPLRMRTRDISDRQLAVLKLIRYKEFVLRAVAHIHRLGPALVVGHDMPAMLPVLAAGKGGCVYNAHEIWSEATAGNAPLRPLWKTLERMVVHRADAVIVPEPHRARILHEEYGARELPAVAANIPPVKSEYEATNVLRERLVLGADVKLVLYQGLLADSRCIEEMIRAVATMPENVHLVLIGKGPPSYEQRCRDAARREPVRGRVHFIAWIPFEDLAAVTASADAGVLLYRNSGRNNYYAAPNKLYEYLFAGLPVVASDFPGLRAVIDADRFGFCADPEDAAAIADAIGRALEMSGGAALAGRARSAFRWEDQVDVIQAVYRRLIGGETAR